MKKVETSLFLLDCKDLAQACTSVRDRSSHSEEMLSIVTLFISYFFLNEKIEVVFLCIFRIIFSTIVCEERNVKFFFLFRICRNFNLESSLNCFPKTFPRNFFLPFGVTFLTDRLIISIKVCRGDSMSIFFSVIPQKAFFTLFFPPRELEFENTPKAFFLRSKLEFLQLPT